MILDVFRSETGKRKYELHKFPSQPKPYEIHVHIWARRDWVLLSTSEYVDEGVARLDFEARRPQMRVDTSEVPMQRGKRLVQEMLTEKLGPKKGNK